MIKFHGTIEHPHTLIFTHGDFSPQKKAFGELLGHLPGDLPGAWTRLAGICREMDKAPPIGANELIRVVTTAKEAPLVLAAARLLSLYTLDENQVTLLSHWIDPDMDSHWTRSDTGPQARGLDRVIGEVLNILCEAGFDVTKLFTGYGAILLSETGWWQAYYEVLVTGMKNGRISSESVKERFLLGLSSAADAPEQVEAVTRVLLELSPFPLKWEHVYQEAVSALRRRRTYIPLGCAGA